FRYLRDMFFFGPGEESHAAIARVDSGPSGVQYEKPRTAHRPADRDGTVRLHGRRLPRTAMPASGAERYGGPRPPLVPAGTDDHHCGFGRRDQEKLLEVDQDSRKGVSRFLLAKWLWCLLHRRV